MRKFMFFAFVLVASINIVMSDVRGMGKSSTSGNEKNKYEVTDERIQLKVDFNHELDLQNAVNDGHQPWRLDPIDVAIAALININISVKPKDCGITRKTDRTALIICNDDKSFEVSLERIIDPKGIWTATEIKIMK